MPSSSLLSHSRPVALRYNSQFCLPAFYIACCSTLIPLKEPPRGTNLVHVFPLPKLGPPYNPFPPAFILPIHPTTRLFPSATIRVIYCFYTLFPPLPSHWLAYQFLLALSGFRHTSSSSRSCCRLSLACILQLLAHVDFLYICTSSLLPPVCILLFTGSISYENESCRKS